NSGENWPTSTTAPQGYTLRDTSGHQEERLCPEHKMPMEVFCKTDQDLICKLCPTLKHRGHEKSYTTKARVRDQLLRSKKYSVIMQYMLSYMFYRVHMGTNCCWREVMEFIAQFFFNSLSSMYPLYTSSPVTCRTFAPKTFFKPFICGKFQNRYACEITFDPNTAHRTLSLTGNKKVTKTKGEQPYPDHPDRFEYYGQVLCRESLCGARFYWETEWTKDAVYIGVTYKGINRKGRGTDCKLGMNNKSWILFCSDDGWYVSYNGKETVIPSPSPSKRMGIYLDWQAGTLSFYIISPDRAYHTYTFHTTFTEPLHPGIRVHSYEGTVTLCELK
uniref:B30.2/SPRY domain-containing protein n=1 Tax=Pygocentrus nattereri TaxID=42514 RepID=A0AAR2LGB6_PYGNA